jgi:hypothetical protein
LEKRGGQRRRGTDQKKKHFYCRETLEAYVSNEGQLRVRAIKKDVDEDGAMTASKGTSNFHPLQYDQLC